MQFLRVAQQRWLTSPSKRKRRWRHQIAAKLFFLWKLCTQRKACLYVRWVDWPRVRRLVRFHGPIPLLIIFALFTMPVLFLQVSRRAGFLAWCCGSDKAHSCKSSSIDVNYSLELSTSTWESPVLTTSHRLSWLSCNTTNQTGGSNWRLTGPTLQLLGPSSVGRDPPMFPRELSPPHPFLKNELGITVQRVHENTSNEKQKPLQCLNWIKQQGFGVFFLLFFFW